MKGNFRQRTTLTFSFPFQFSVESLFRHRVPWCHSSLSVWPVIWGCHKAVASKLHGVEVEISVVKRKGEQLYDDNTNNSSDTDLSMPAEQTNSSTSVNSKKLTRNILHHSNSNAVCTSRHNEKLIRSSNSLESQCNDNCNTIIAATASTMPTKAPVMTKPPRKREVERSDHIQFLITEKTPHRTCAANDAVVREPVDEGDVVTEGTFNTNCAAEKNERKKKLGFS